MSKRMLFLIPGLLLGVVALSACEGEGPAEETAEDVGQQMDETAEAGGERIEEIEESLSDVPEETAETAERVTDEAESETDY